MIIIHNIANKPLLCINKTPIMAYCVTVHTITNYFKINLSITTTGNAPLTKLDSTTRNKTVAAKKLDNDKLKNI